MSKPQTGSTHYHAQLGSPDNDSEIKGLVVCYVLYYGYEVKDQESNHLVDYSVQVQLTHTK